MDINFDRINNDLENIVNEFEDLLTKGKYDEARDAVNAIVMELATNTDIELDVKNGMDNNFYELYKALDDKIKSKGSSPKDPAAGNTTDYGKLKDLFKNVSRQIFNTQEVRSALIMKDPEMDEYKKALEQGIIENNARKEDLESQKNLYEVAKKAIYTDNTKTPPEDLLDKIDKAIEEFNAYDEVESKIDAIIKRLDWINDPSNSDPSKDAQKNKFRSEIIALKDEIKKLIDDMNTKGFDTKAFGNPDDFVNESNISNSKTIIAGITQTILNNEVAYAKIIKENIENIQKGSVVFDDGKGNKINLKDVEMIRNIDVSTIDFTTDPVNDVATIFGISDEIDQKVGEIDNQINLCAQENEIFSDHVRVIDFELEQLAKDPNDREAYIEAMDDAMKQSIADEKQNKKEDAIAKFYGDSKKNKEYKAAWKRFNNHRIPKQDTYTYNGNVINYEYEEIEDYVETEGNRTDDLAFMQLETWNDRRKNIGIIEAITNGMTDPDEIAKAIASVYGNHEVERLANELGAMNPGTTPQADINAKRVELETAKAKVFAQFTRDKDYIDNYNSSHFDVKDTVAIALTGGSAMRARTNQSKKNLTLKDGVMAFFGLTPYDVKADGKRHIRATTISNIFGIASTPVRAIKVAMGVTVGAVTAAIGKVTGTYNMPTPYKVGYLDRREARLEYYRNHGSTRMGAWVKSLFNLNVKDENGNKIKLNEKLINDRVDLINESIDDMYIRRAREKLIADQIAARRNVEARKAAYKNQVKSAEMYEDIYINNPENIIIKGQRNTVENNPKIKTISQKAMQMGALSLGGKNQGPITNTDQSFIENGKKRTGKFVQNNPKVPTGNVDFNVKGGYDFSEKVGEAVWTNAISRENMQRARTRGMDLAIRIAGVAVIPAFKGLLSRYTVKMFKQPDEYVPPQIVTASKDSIVKGQRPIIGEKQIEIVDTHTEAVSADNLTFGDIQRGSKAYWSADLDNYTGSHAPGTFSNAATQIQGANFHFTDPLTGQEYNFSFSPSSHERFVQSHNLNSFSSEYHDAISFDANDNVVDAVIQHMPKEMGEGYRRFLDEAAKAGNFEEAFEQSTKFAYGIPSDAAETMSQGWSETIIDGAVKTISETKTKYIKDVIGYEDYDIASVGPVTQQVIQGYVKQGSYVAVPAGYVIGAAGMLMSDLKQMISPVYRRGQKLTQNYENMTDMYQSPLDENGNPLGYQSSKSKSDRALNTYNHEGKPIVTDSNGNPVVLDLYDDDDFVL